MNELFNHELVYSGIARYIQSLNLVSKSKILTDILGSRGATAIYDLPVNLGYFCSHNYPGGDYAPDYLIDYHTTIPYYAPFVLQNILSKARETMMGQGKVVKALLGIFRRGLNLKTHFYYCPLCVIENRRQLGETYWHRLFQIPDVNICPFHYVWLKPTNVLLRNINNRGAFIPAELQRFETDVREFNKESIAEKFYFEYSRDILWLLENNHTDHILNLNILKRKLYAALSKAGFASFKTLYIKKLVSEFIKFYPMQYLRQK